MPFWCPVQHFSFIHSFVHSFIHGAEIKPRVLHMLGKHSITKLPPQFLVQDFEQLPETSLPYLPK
jgi:hypothetical protein